MLKRKIINHPISSLCTLLIYIFKDKIVYQTIKFKYGIKYICYTGTKTIQLIYQKTFLFTGLNPID